MIKFFNLLSAKVLKRLISWAEKLLLLLNKRKYNVLKRLNRITLSEEIIQELTQSRDKYKEQPQIFADSLASHNSLYKEIVYTYSLTKQAIAISEAYSNELPLNIFNEMRNALDHFIRSMITTEEDADSSERIERQIGSVQKHLRRAFLDVVKVICAYFDENIRLTHLRFSAKSIGLVNNGEYIKNVTRLQNEARFIFTKAKTKEFELANSGTNKYEVLDLFLDSLLAHKKTRDYQLEHISLLKWAGAKAIVLGGFGITISFFTGVLATLFAAVFCTLIFGEDYVQVIASYIGWFFP